jgi:hypothetical protein
VQTLTEFIDTIVRGLQIFLGELLSPIGLVVAAGVVLIVIGVPWTISRLITRSERR